MINKNNPKPDSSHPRIGIALGSGAARGWAHIGALQQLATMGIHPEIISGCSIGSIVGAAYAADNLAKLEKWVLALNKLETMRYFEVNTSLKGFIRQEKLRRFFHENVCSEKQSIEGLKYPYATVATDLHSGREVWLTEGKVIDASWASIAIPGLFQPFAHNNRWLVDGGLVNPVPVSLCRAMGADIIIAINLNSGVMRTRHRNYYASLEANNKESSSSEKLDEDDDGKEQNIVQNVASSLLEYSSTLLPQVKNSNPVPGLLNAIAGSIYIMQDNITRSRMVGDPPEILLNPRVSEVGLLEFHRAAEAIEEGRQCVIRMQSEIEHVMAEMT